MRKKLAVLAVSAIFATAVPVLAVTVGKWTELGKVEDNTIKIGAFVSVQVMTADETPARLTFKFRKNDKISDFSIVRKGEPNVTVMENVSAAELDGDEYSFTIMKSDADYVARATYALETTPVAGIHISGGDFYEITAAEPTGTVDISVDNDNIFIDGGESADIIANAFWNGAAVADPVEFEFAVKSGEATDIVTIGEKIGGKVTVTAAKYGSTVLTVSADIYGETKTADVAVNVVDTHTVFVSEDENITEGAKADATLRK